MVKKDNNGSNWLKRQYLKTLIKGYAKKRVCSKKLMRNIRLTLYNHRF